MHKALWAAMIVIGGSSGVTPASAVPLRLLLESDQDRNGTQEVFLATFNTFDDLVNSGSGGSGGAFSGLDIGPGFSVGGLAYDGQFRLLLESDQDRNGTQEVFLATFNTFDDLVNSGSGGSGGVFSGLDIGPGFSVGGLAYDGQFRLLLESDQDRNGTQEVFLATFNTFDDLVNSGSGGSGGVFSGLDIGPGFSVGGLAYDGQLRLLLESDQDRSGSQEVFLATFSTFDDLVNSGSGGSGGVFSGLDIGPGFSVRGLANEFQPAGLVPVSEPGVLSLIVAALCGPLLLGRHRLTFRAPTRALQTHQRPFQS